MLSNLTKDDNSEAEILSPSGNLSSSKLIYLKDNNVSIEYDREIRGYIFNLKKPSSNLTYPFKKANSSSASSVGIRQALVVFQLKVPTDRQFNLELTVLSTKNSRYILHFSSSFKAVNVKNLCCQIPWHSTVESIWTNYVLNIAYYVSYWFPDAQFSRIESFVVKSSHAAIRKVFSLEYPSEGCKLLIPATMEFPLAVNGGTMLRSPELDKKIQMEKIQVAAPVSRVRARLSEARNLALINQTAVSHSSISFRQSSPTEHHDGSFNLIPVAKTENESSQESKINLDNHFDDSQSFKSEAKAEDFTDGLQSTNTYETCTKDIPIEHDSMLTNDKSTDEWRNITNIIRNSTVEEIQRGLVTCLWALDADFSEFQLEYGC